LFVGVDNIPGLVDHGGRDPVRVVLSGCGAVTRMYYIEALTRLQRAGIVRVIGIFDPNPTAMNVVRNRFPSVVAVTLFGDLLRLGADAMIVASPPRFHADQAVESLNAGLHVFCEKPLATTSRDADRILATANEMGLAAGVGLVRRQFPATQANKGMLKRGAIGRVCGMTCFEGGPFDWPSYIATLFQLERIWRGRSSGHRNTLSRPSELVVRPSNRYLLLG
jgi:predicted dehydrogenase